MTSIERTIMRRVYYSYLLSFFTHTMFWQGIVLGASVFLFGRLTHVASIIHNFLATPISNSPNFILNAFIHAIDDGQVLTVLVVILMVILSITISLKFITLFSRTSGQYQRI